MEQERDDLRVTQQRQFPRYALEAALTLRIGDREVHGRSSNLSRGGLCAMLVDPVPAGVRVDIEVALVFDNDSFSEPLALSGRVVWCTALEGGHQVGLAFTPLRAEQSRYLDVFLGFLKGDR